MGILLAEATTISDLVTINAIMDSGLLKSTESYLVITDVTTRFEAWSAIMSTIQEYEYLTSRFTKICYLNDLIFPQHPVDLRTEDESPASINRLKSLIGVEYAENLLLVSIQTPPASFLAEIYNEATINVYADGLMVYSPTRTDLPKSVLKRIKRVFYYDYISPIKPFVLLEAHPEYIPIPKSSYKKLIMKKPKFRNDTKKNIVIIGQYLGDIGFISHEEEYQNYRRILQAEFDQYGLQFNYIFRPHPTSRISYGRRLMQFAEEKGIPLCIDDTIAPVEFLYNKDNTEKVAGMFSTSLFSLRFLHDIPAKSYFCDILYDKMMPFLNSNRTPLIIAHMLLGQELQETDTALLYAYLLINNIASHPDRMIAEFPMLNSEEPLSLCMKYLHDKNDSFMQRPIIELNRKRSKKDESDENSHAKYKEYKQLAEDAIDSADYMTAKDYFIKALAIRPSNTACLKRLAALTMFPSLRNLMLKATRKYRDL